MDASVVMKLFVEEEWSGEARAFFARFERSDAYLLAPDLLYLECANGLVKQVQRSVLALERAVAALQILRTGPINIVPTWLVVDDALQTAVHHGLTAYDAAYVALARMFDAMVVSDDRRMLAGARASGLGARHVSEV